MLRAPGVRIVVASPTRRPRSCPFRKPYLRCVAVETHVTAGRIVIGLILQESPEEMAFPTHRDVSIDEILAGAPTLGMFDHVLRDGGGYTVVTWVDDAVREDLTVGRMR